MLMKGIVDLSFGLLLCTMGFGPGGPKVRWIYGLSQKVYEVAHGPGLHHSSKFLMLLPVFQEKILQNDMGVISVHYGTLGFLFPNNFPFCGYPT